MTGLREAGRPASFTVEYDCERRCQAELDLSGIHIRFTLGQMLEAADRAHVEAHCAKLPRKVFPVGDEIVVRAHELEPAS